MLFGAPRIAKPIVLKKQHPPFAPNPSITSHKIPPPPSPARHFAQHFSHPFIFSLPCPSEVKILRRSTVLSLKKSGSR